MSELGGSWASHPLQLGAVRLLFTGFRLGEEAADRCSANSTSLPPSNWVTLGRTLPFPHRR
jgi:hypothetical protein